MSLQSTGAAGTPLKLQVGTYQVRVQAEGFLPFEVRAAIRENETEKVTAALVPLPPRVGTLLVSAGGREAKVWLDGKAVGVTPLTLRAVEVGERSIETKAAGCKGWKGRIRVQEGKVAFVDAAIQCDEAP